MSNDRVATDMSDSLVASHPVNIDLHCHSRYSDGVLTPTELVNRAADNGVSVLALTDHDEIGGLAEARAAAADRGLQFVNGVEISVTWGSQTVHIVGLNIDAADTNLINALTGIRAGRENRARQMSESLANAGIANAYEGALSFVSNPALVSRTHFARHLVATGICESVGKVFRDYLVPGKPGHAPHQWADLTDAVQWILGAGGTAVIAHPGRYRFDEVQLHAMIKDFVDAGGQAIEVVTGSHTKDQYEQFASIAVQYGLLGSRGSDFHGPTESRLDLGELVALPGRVVPVWADWELLHS